MLIRRHGQLSVRPRLRVKFSGSNKIGFLRELKRWVVKMIETFYFSEQKKIENLESRELEADLVNGEGAGGELSEFWFKLGECAATYRK